MPRVRPIECTDCGATAAAGASISWAGRCTDCSAARAAQAALAMHSRDGEHYRRWLASAGPRGRPPGGKGVVPG